MSLVMNPLHESWLSSTSINSGLPVTGGYGGSTLWVNRVMMGYTVGSMLAPATMR